MSGVDHPSSRGAIEIQRAYYADTAHQYDDMHHDEVSFPLEFMISAIKYLGVTSVLDIGSGTGRAVLKIKNELPDVRVVGVEPSPELRKIGYSKALLETELIDGDATNLAFEDGAFDLVCEFSVLHHIPTPSKAVSEMLRVSSKAIFIADSNNFGQGGRVFRLFKQAINAAGLWPLADKIKTKGKGYTISEGDGLAYSYSVFNDYRQIKDRCTSVHMMNTQNAKPDLYRTAPGVALLGIKRAAEMTVGAE